MHAQNGDPYSTQSHMGNFQIMLFFFGYRIYIGTYYSGLPNGTLIFGTTHAHFQSAQALPVVLRCPQHILKAAAAGAAHLKRRV